jgi:hypothetical protein
MLGPLRAILDEQEESQSQNESGWRGNEELLQHYLDLSAEERDMQFADVVRAAQLAGLSPRTIQRWAKHRHIRAVLVAERYRIEIKSLYNYIKKRARARGN